MRFARPIERAIQRFWMGPPSIATLVTTSFSASAFSFSVAFAMADPSTFTNIVAAFRCCSRRIDIASSTERPRIMSATARIFRGDSRNPLNTARAICRLLLLCRSRGGRCRCLAFAGVTVEGAGRRELTQLVANHVLRGEHRDELPPVVNREGDPEHFGEDGRSPRPGLEDLLRLL